MSRSRILKRRHGRSWVPEGHSEASGNSVSLKEENWVLGDVIGQEIWWNPSKPMKNIDVFSLLINQFLRGDMSSKSILEVAGSPGRRVCILGLLGLLSESRFFSEHFFSGLKAEDSRDKFSIRRSNKVSDIMPCKWWNFCFVSSANRNQPAPQRQANGKLLSWGLGTETFARDFLVAVSWALVHIYLESYQKQATYVNICQHILSSWVHVGQMLGHIWSHLHWFLLIMSWAPFRQVGYHLAGAVIHTDQLKCYCSSCLTTSRWISQMQDVVLRGWTYCCLSNNKCCRPQSVVFRILLQFSLSHSIVHLEYMVVDLEWNWNILSNILKPSSKID